MPETSRPAMRPIRICFWRFGFMANPLDRVLELESDGEVHPVAARILLTARVDHRLEPAGPLLEVVVEGVDGLEVPGLALDGDGHAVLLDGLEPDIVRQAVGQF